MHKPVFNGNALSRCGFYCPPVVTMCHYSCKTWKNVAKNVSNVENKCPRVRPQCCLQTFAPIRVVVSAFILRWRVPPAVASPPLVRSSVQSLFTWIRLQHRAGQSGCPVSLIPPPGRRSGASGAGCRSPPRTPHRSRPEGWWASWRSP